MAHTLKSSIESIGCHPQKDEQCPGDVFICEQTGRKKNVSILVWRILVLVEMLAKQNRSASLSQNMAYFVTNLANGDFILKDLPL